MLPVERPASTPTPARPSAGRRPSLALLLVAAAALSACTAVGLTDDTVDYGQAKQRRAPLDVPPDLTQLARDPRYVPESGTISATRFESAQSSPSPLGDAATGGEKVAPTQVADMRIIRDGSQRWLVTPLAPEAAWPKVRAFWEQRGLTLVVDQPEVGVMETEWAENRAKIPQDLIRRTIGRVFESAYSTGTRDKFRTRVERTPNGSEIFITHRGVEEVYSSRDQTSVVWQPAAENVDLEAEMLSRLRLALAGEPAPQNLAAPEDAASGVDATAIAAAAASPEAPVTTTPARARMLAGQPGAALQVDETFDRAWRRVGLALDRGGFTVEDRDRSGGLYFVRYVDPKDAGKEEPGFFSRLFGKKDGPGGPLRYRIALKTEGEATTVSVLDAQGAPESGPNGQRIVTQLVRDLR